MSAQVRAGRWGRVGRGVYVAHTGRLSYEERIFSGLAACGGGGVASHETAIWLADRADVPPKLVHITIPSTQRVEHSQRDLVVHRTREPLAVDVHPARRPPQFTVERAVLDCVRVAVTDDQAIAVVARTVQRGLTTADRLHARFTQAATLPRRRMLLDVVELAGKGAHSAAEVRYHQQARVHGLPAAECQVRQVIGGATYLDARYRRHPGRRVVVEIDGRLGHYDFSSWRRDMLRDAAQIVAGDLVLRLPALFLFTDPGRIMVPVAALLKNEGWAGEMRQCRNRGCSCHRPDEVWSVAS